jgi:hypothetical protein
MNENQQSIFWFIKEKSPWKWVVLILAIFSAFIFIFDVRIGSPFVESDFKKDKSEVFPPGFRQNNEVNCGF